MKRLAIILLLIVGVLYLCGRSADNPEETTGALTTGTAEAEAAEAAKVPYSERLKTELASLDNFKVESYTETKESVLMCAVLFAAWADFVEQGEKEQLTDEDRQQLARFKSSVSRIQRAAFPKLRDAYGPIARKALWENDIEAKTMGEGFRTIEFVGGVFAANRNKQEFQEGVSSVLHQLRFKRANYKWYSGEDQYTYYTVNSFDDDDLVVWENGMPSRALE